MSEVSSNQNAAKLRRNALILALLFLFPILVMTALTFFRKIGMKRVIADPAIYAAQTSPALEAQIGIPIEPGWPVRGSVVTKGGNGNAYLEIPISGPQGRGVLTQWSLQKYGTWRLCALHFHPKEGATLEIVSPANTGCHAD